MYKVKNAMPADCVYLALHTICADKKPDLIISGINQGANLAEDTSYSGTVGAAIEAVLHGFKSFAISQFRPKKSEVKNFQYDFRLAVQVALDIACKTLNNELELPDRSLLNINIPSVAPKDCKGYKVTHCGYKTYNTTVKKLQDAYGGEHYWMALDGYEFADQINSDYAAVMNHQVSITPLKVDMTDTATMKSLQTVLEC